MAHKSIPFPVQPTSLSESPYAMKPLYTVAHEMSGDQQEPAELYNSYHAREKESSDQLVPMEADSREIGDMARQGNTFHSQSKSPAGLRSSHHHRNYKLLMRSLVAYSSGRLTYVHTGERRAGIKPYFCVLWRTRPSHSSLGYHQESLQNREPLNIRKEISTN